MSRAELAETLGINYRTLGPIEEEDYKVSRATAIGISRIFGLLLEVVSSGRPMRRIADLLREDGDGNADGSAR